MRSTRRKWRESTRTGGKNPGRQATQPAAVAREPPTRDHAVQMRMMDERLAPCVQHGEEADLGAEVMRVGSDRAERLGGGAKEQTVDNGLVLGGDLGDHRRHG